MPNSRFSTAAAGDGARCFPRPQIGIGFRPRQAGGYRRGIGAQCVPEGLRLLRPVEARDQVEVARRPAFVVRPGLQQLDLEAQAAQHEAGDLGRQVLEFRADAALEAVELADVAQDLLEAGDRGGVGQRHQHAPARLQQQRRVHPVGREVGEVHMDHGIDAEHRIDLPRQPLRRDGGQDRIRLHRIDLVQGQPAGPDEILQPRRGGIQEVAADVEAEQPHLVAGVQHAFGVLAAAAADLDRRLPSRDARRDEQLVEDALPALLVAPFLPGVEQTRIGLLQLRECLRNIDIPELTVGLLLHPTPLRVAHKLPAVFPG
jgi:hypothetical protein